MAILLSITPIKIPDSSCTQSWILTINHSQASPKDIDWNSVANINKLCDRSENVSLVHSLLAKTSSGRVLGLISQNKDLYF